MKTLDHEDLWLLYGGALHCRSLEVTSPAVSCSWLPLSLRLLVACLAEIQRMIDRVMRQRDTLPIRAFLDPSFSILFPFNSLHFIFPPY